MYRTGDRVKWTAEGNLEFLGRDGLSGKGPRFRVELREIGNGLAELWVRAGRVGDPPTEKVRRNG